MNSEIGSVVICLTESEVKKEFMTITDSKAVDGLTLTREQAIELKNRLESVLGDQ